MTPDILILGKNGQVGRALVKRLSGRALAADREEVNFLDPDFISKLEQWLNGRPVGAVINAVAYTQVDKAEGEDKEAAFRINGSAVGELAEWCRKRDLPLVHYSTDYVFDGSGDKPRRESDTPNPINAYGQSKLEGERAVQATGGNYLILRTSWVYDARGKNFYTTILRLLHERESLNVVSDQIGAPTYATHLARVTLDILSKNFVPGLYHLCNSGKTSWYEFADRIFALARVRDSGIKCQHVDSIPTSAYPLPARRPLNSQLDCSRAREVLGVVMPSWEEGLKECFKERYAG